MDRVARKTLTKVLDAVSKAWFWGGSKKEVKKVNDEFGEKLVVVDTVNPDPKKVFCDQNWQIITLGRLFFRKLVAWKMVYNELYDLNPKLMKSIENEKIEVRYKCMLRCLKQMYPGIMKKEIMRLRKNPKLKGPSLSL